MNYFKSSKIKPPPRSCDTCVVIPKNKEHPIIFGKNSDRPDDEAQHVVAYPAVDPSSSTTSSFSLQKCTYISIPQSPTGTRAVILSKPEWMWGAEMATNDAGLVIGNEAVWTNEPDDGPEALLGMDLVRLAAERCTSAVAAIELIGSLLETYGQGGGCEQGGSWSYHNSFLIVDRSEAWVMETAGTWWIAESIIDTDDDQESNFQYRNISNCLSIRTLDTSKGRKYLHSVGLLEYAVDAGYWNGQGQFDWAYSFSSTRPPLGQKTPGREAAGHELLRKLTDNTEIFTAEMMMEVLRDQKSGICMCGGGFRSNGSQVSVIFQKKNDGSIDSITNKENSTIVRDVHYFTGTPDPSISCFKPLSFPSFKTTAAAVAAGEAVDEKNNFGGNGVGETENRVEDENSSEVPLERINDIAVELWNHGDRRKSSARAKLKELERIGVESVDLSEIGGARVFLQLAQEELQI